VNPGFSSETLTFRVFLDERYNKRELRAAFYKSLLGKLELTRGAKYVGASSSLPLSHHESVTFAEVRGLGKTNEMVEDRSVTPGYRKALGTPLLRGRDFTEADINRPVVIVNDRFAQSYLHGSDPLGRQLRVGIGDLSKAGWSTVIGVIGDIRHNTLEETSQPQIFEPAHTLAGINSFAIQSSGPVQPMISEAQAALHSLDPSLTLESIHTMAERMSESNARRTFQTALVSAFAAIAVALALAGLYGLMSYTVKQRTPEIAVRMAVGAQRRRILGLILFQAVSVMGLGLLIGLCGAFALTHLVSAWLFGVTPIDPITFVGVPIFVLIIGPLACLPPAWSATRVDPTRALRQE